MYMYIYNDTDPLATPSDRVAVSLWIDAWL